MSAQPKKLTMAVKEYFNIPLSQMREEYAKLTEKDKQDLKDEFAKVGITIAD